MVGSRCRYTSQIIDCKYDKVDICLWTNTRHDTLRFTPLVTFSSCKYPKQTQSNEQKFIEPENRTNTRRPFSWRSTTRFPKWTSFNKDGPHVVKGERSMGIEGPRVNKMSTVVIWDPLCEQGDRHHWKPYIPASSLAGCNNLNHTHTSIDGEILWKKLL